MNASEAKRPFSWKTLLCEIADHLYNKLKVPKKERLSIEKNGSLGFMPTVAIDLKLVAKKSECSTFRILGLTDMFVSMVSKYA